MLSFLCRLATEYEREHGHRPNLLYISPQHFQSLRQDLANIHGLGQLVRFLGMEIVIAPDACHPHLSYSRAMWHEAIAV
ncbi:MAG: hypothetical protein GC149_00125 [Gammaproteobacteria bacterium]|nr:hypothetical protein [Gammaproteobacteria bacterium]